MSLALDILREIKNLGKFPNRKVATETHCSQGHPWTPETTYLYLKGGYRQCRICTRAIWRNYYHAKKGCVGSPRRTPSPRSVA